MKNIIIITIALFFAISHNLSAKVNTEALAYTLCQWNSTFEYPKKHYFHLGDPIYVRVKPQNQYDIKYMEIWVDNQYIRRETSAPYEWGIAGSHADVYLRNLQPGVHKIKCKILDKCGQSHFIYYEIQIKGENNFCNNSSWFKYPQNNKHYHQGNNIYVRVDCQKYQDIEFMELYLNNEFIHKENQYPFEWCKENGNSDYKLRNLKKGYYTLKLKIKDKCGKYSEKKCTFYVD